MNEPRPLFVALLLALLLSLSGCGRDGAMISMLHFGKGVIAEAELSGIVVNTELEPVLFRYYLSGNWSVY